ncbi:60S ribosomal protein L5-1 [Hibiscus syriacus]|uniref:60S ribosomal protein L5-1 n=1 Tax=Hibiscus syriacus TaxID=106335 RepID=A0A6A3BB58_HIBSY|nr:60S ribosomal protein L5-1 [Hibiscus syriacus]
MLLSSAIPLITCSANLGSIQSITEAPKNLNYLHNIDRRGKKEVNWLMKHNKWMTIISGSTRMRKCSYFSRKHEVGAFISVEKSVHRHNIIVLWKESSCLKCHRSLVKRHRIHFRCHHSQFRCLRHREALDVGLDIPHSDKRFVGCSKDSKQLDAEALMEDEPEKYQSHFSEYIKRGIEADNIESLYKKVHAAISADPSAKKSEKAPPKQHKKELTYEERKAKLIERLKPLNAAVGADSEDED